MGSAKKIEFEELFNSTTMFYVNEKYEEEMEQEVQSKVDELADELHSINTKEGLITDFSPNNIRSLVF